MSEDRKWEVSLSNKVKKQKKRLSQKAQDLLFSLQIALKKDGPIQKEWPNFSALDKKRLIYHCHMNKKGRPTYVAIWQVLNKKIKLIEISYVGTREGVPYR